MQRVILTDDVDAGRDNVIKSQTGTIRLTFELNIYKFVPIASYFEVFDTMASNEIALVLDLYNSEFCVMRPLQSASIGEADWFHCPEKLPLFGAVDLLMAIQVFYHLPLAA